MKKLITITLIALSLYTYSQPAINIWRVTPDTVCAGDSIKIDYKSMWPTTPDNTLNYFFANPGTVALWSGNWSILKARPKEHYFPLGVGDSTYWIKVRIPTAFAVGNYTISSNGSGSGVIYVKNCVVPCAVTSNFTYSVGANGVVNFTSTSTGANSYTWSNGANTPTTAITYTNNGTYTVSLISASSATCSEVNTQTITVGNINAVGIAEYELNKVTPVYYDVYGNVSEKTKGVLLIEVIGTKRTKVVFIE